jgi:hypothetical protein
MVTAEGKPVNVSKDENAELFWAIRGGGSTFGVVTNGPRWVETFSRRPTTTAWPS